MRGARVHTTPENLERLATRTATVIGAKMGAFAGRADDVVALEPFCATLAR